MADDSGFAASEFSVGEIAARTGLRPATLRVWERRYGFPVPIRKPSGHRVYSETDLVRLTLIVRAMRLGLRAGDVVRRPEDELVRMVSSADASANLEGGPSLVDLVNCVAALDSGRLQVLLADQLEALGPSRFAIECLGPLLAQIGELWARGAIAVHQEHMASEIIQDVSRGVFRRYVSNEGPLVLLTTLPGEQHALGITIAGLICVDRGFRVLVLGRETPPNEIVEATRLSGARVVGLSVSEATGRPETTACIKALRATLPGEVELMLGGSGSLHTRRGLSGVHYVHRPDSLARVLDLLVERCGFRG